MIEAEMRSGPPAEFLGVGPVGEPLARVAGHRAGRRDLKLLQRGIRFGRGVCLARTGAARATVEASEPNNAKSHPQNEG